MDLLTNNCVTGETLGYKQVLLQDMRKRFDSLCAIFGATAHAAPPAPAAAAPSPAPAAAVAALVEPAPPQASERLF